MGYNISIAKLRSLMIIPSDKGGVISTVFLSRLAVLHNGINEAPIHDATPSPGSHRNGRPAKYLSDMLAMLYR
jgi:hypothetical protein